MKTSGRPSNKKLGRKFRSPDFKSGSFKPPSFRQLPTGEVRIKANQVRDIVRASGRLEADIVNEQVSAERNPEVWEEVEEAFWVRTTSTSATSRITRMKKSVTSALRKLRRLG